MATCPQHYNPKNQVSRIGFQEPGFRNQKFQELGSKNLVSRIKFQESGFKNQVSRIRFQESGFKNQDSRIRLLFF